MKGNVLDYLKLRILSFYNEALMLKDGKMPPPRMCILYPTYSCNCNCIGCDYAETNKNPKSFSDKEFDRTIDQIISIGIKSVEFCGGGEATLHRSLPKAVDKLTANKIAFGFLTNGTNLTDELMEKLVTHGSYCRISVEAGSKEVFDKYKRPKTKNAGFENVIKNIKKLVALRNAHIADSKLQISYKYSIDKNNYEDVFNAIDLANKLKVDSIQFKCVRNVPSEITDNKTINRLIKGFDKMKLKYPDFSIMDNIGKSELTKCRCWLSVFQLTIDPYGDVYICCYYRHRMEKHKLGNVLKQDLNNIWYSQEHWHKISQIDTSDCNKYDCRFHYYNELMNDLVIKDTGQLRFI
jgi:MoaA/NifB/PqqE/SkfB family radical SAM enzyme